MGLLERDGKGNDNNIELRLELTLCSLQLGEEPSLDFIPVSVPPLTHWYLSVYYKDCSTEVHYCTVSVF